METWKIDGQRGKMDGQRGKMMDSVGSGWKMWETVEKDEKIKMNRKCGTRGGTERPKETTKSVQYKPYKLKRAGFLLSKKKIFSHTQETKTGTIPICTGCGMRTK